MDDWKRGRRGARAKCIVLENTSETYSFAFQPNTNDTRGKKHSVTIAVIMMAMETIKPLLVASAKLKAIYSNFVINTTVFRPLRFKRHSAHLSLKLLRSPSFVFVAQRVCIVHYFHTPYHAGNLSAVDRFGALLADKLQRCNELNISENITSRRKEDIITHTERDYFRESYLISSTRYEALVHTQHWFIKEPIRLFHVRYYYLH